MNSNNASLTFFKIFILGIQYCCYNVSVAVKTLKYTATEIRKIAIKYFY